MYLFFSCFLTFGILHKINHKSSYHLGVSSYLFLIRGYLMG